VTQLRRCHGAPFLLALVGLMLASALVAVGAHEHDLWGGDTPDGVVCVVDHDAAGGPASSASSEAAVPVVRTAGGPHRHVCVGLHGATHPPAVHRALTPRPFDTASRPVAILAASPAELHAAVVLPGPRGPPAA
jgi:hypothetical protein